MLKCPRRKSRTRHRREKTKVHKPVRAPRVSKKHLEAIKMDESSSRVFGQVGTKLLVALWSNPSVMLHINQSRALNLWHPNRHLLLERLS